MSNHELFLKKIVELEERIIAIEKKLSTQNPSSPILDRAQNEKQISIKEFLLSKPATSTVQKTLIIGYFLEYLIKMPFFNIGDIENSFRSAKEKPPTNLNDMINKNIAKGYLMEAKEKKDTKKAWCLTASGEKFVQSLGLTQ